MGQSSQLDDPIVFDKVTELIQQGETNTTIAKIISREFTKVSRDAIRRFRRRHQLPNNLVSEVRITENEASFTIKESYTDLNDPDKLIEERGLSPEDWEIESARLSEWGSVENPNKQLRINLKRKVTSLVFPARPEGWKAPPKIQKSDKERETIVILGDLHCPFHERKLHTLFCQWLRDNKPERGIINGDVMDWPDISRHRPDPENIAFLNECTQSAYEVLRDYVDASPQTKWQMTPGNHDYERLRNWLIDYSRQLYGIRRANDPQSVLTVPFLLRLDELDIEYIEPTGKYTNAKIAISDKLAVKHGDTAAKGAGATALKSMDRFDHSIVVNHVHRLAIVYKTKHEMSGKPQILVGVEAGAMCSIDQRNDFEGRVYPAYLEDCDWQNGFCVIESWEDLFHVNQAIYIDGTLLWRNERYDF